jgi:DNA polymerase I-like protein with 3'-5' exonuclease and polymerase domains
VAVQLSAFPTFTAPEDPGKQIITSGERFERLIRFLESRPWLIFDYETSGTAWYLHAEAVGVGLGSWDDQGELWSAYVPFRHRTREPQLDINIIGSAIQKLLADPQSFKIAHNIKFEDHFSRREGWTIEGPRYDTMIAARLYDENRYMDLEGRASQDLGLGEEAYEGKRRITDCAKMLAKQNKMGLKKYLWHHGYSEIPVQLCGWYACHDVHYTGELYKFYEASQLSGRHPRIWPTEMALTEVLTDMERTGLPLDIP